MDAVYWWAFEAPTWARYAIAGLSGTLVGALFGELVRRLFRLNQAPGLVTLVPILAGFAIAQFGPRSLSIAEAPPPPAVAKQASAPFTVSDFDRAFDSLPDYFQVAFRDDPKALEAFRDIVRQVDALNLPEQEKVTRLSVSAFPLLMSRLEAIRIRADVQSQRQGQLLTIKIAKTLRRTPDMCASYFQSAVGLGEGFNINELARTIGPELMLEMENTNRRLVMSGAESPRPVLEYSPEADLLLQERAFEAGWSQEFWLPDLSSMSSEAICDWLINFTTFVLKQNDGDFLLFTRNEFANIQRTSTMQNGAIPWSVQLLGGNNEAGRYYQLLAWPVGRNDGFSLNCETSGFGSAYLQSYFVGTDELASGQFLLVFENGEEYSGTADVEQGTNILINEPISSNLNAELLRAIRNGSVITLNLIGTKPRKYNLSGGKAYVEAFLDRCKSQ
jgi:hypothetical protein